LWNGPQGDTEYNINGYMGLFYHFLDINSGFRTWSCELSTIDTALLMAGILDAKQYFDTPDAGDVQLRALSDSLYYRVDWEFVRNGGNGIRMGWKPATGFSGFGSWVGYNEAMILYLLALGSPTHPVPWYTWAYWTTGYNWSTQYGQTYVIFPPLFGHQYSHCWIDFRNIEDAYMQLRGIDYFENSRRATLAAREYCIANPLGWTGYGENLWGLTASDDPGGYLAHGAPPAQNDNGTITPTAAASSIAFAPEVVIPALHNMYDNYAGLIWGQYGFKDAFNLSVFWTGSDYIGIDQGPIVMMIENYLTGAVWDRFRQNPDIQAGLSLAGFNSVSPVPEGPYGPLTAVELGQNAPNPFHGSTLISYRVATPGPVTLRVYDLRGQCVREIDHRAADNTLQQITLDARGLASGIYSYSLEANGHMEWKRCIIIK
ncbi:MAG: glucoamylase family protein, partial [bacterium]